MITGRLVQGVCSQQSAEGGAQPMETQDVSGKGTATAKSGASGAASRWQLLPDVPCTSVLSSSHYSLWRHACA